MQDQPYASDALDGLLSRPPEFTAQGIEVHIDGAGVVLKTRPPHMIQYLPARTDAVGVIREIVQQAVFQACQMNLLTILAHTA